MKITSCLKCWMHKRETTGNEAWIVQATLVILFDKVHVTLAPPGPSTTSCVMLQTLFCSSCWIQDQKGQLMYMIQYNGIHKCVYMCCQHRYTSNIHINTPINGHKCIWKLTLRRMIPVCVTELSFTGCFNL